MISRRIVLASVRTDGIWSRWMDGNKSTPIQLLCTLHVNIDASLTFGSKFIHLKMKSFAQNSQPMFPPPNIKTVNDMPLLTVSIPIFFITWRNSIQRKPIRLKIFSSVFSVGTRFANCILVDVVVVVVVVAEALLLSFLLGFSLILSISLLRQVCVIFSYVGVSIVLFIVSTFTVHEWRLIQLNGTYNHNSYKDWIYRSFS